MKNEDRPEEVTMPGNLAGLKGAKAEAGMLPGPARGELTSSLSSRFADPPACEGLEGAGTEQKGEAAVAKTPPTAWLHTEKRPFLVGSQIGDAAVADLHGGGPAALPIEQETAGRGGPEGTQLEGQTPSLVDSDEARRQGIRVVRQGGRPEEAIEGSPRQEVDFAVLENGSLVELVEDPGDPSRTALAVWKDGQISYTDRLEFAGQVFVPPKREAQVLNYLRLPRGAWPYESVQELLYSIENLIGSCVVLDQPYLDVVARFALTTWLIDRLPVAPYVSLVGLPQSGKTTLLSALSLVCRRPLLTADISSAAFYEACARLTPTLLIDETGTHRDNRYLRHLLRVGTTRGVVAVRKNQRFHAYGAKVICFLEPPDDPALNSRCILIPMTEANRPDLRRPTDPVLEELAMRLQQQLLQFRFDHYQIIQLIQVPGAERLRPRARDLFNCLVAVYPDDPRGHQPLLDFFRRQDVTTREPLSPAQNAVLSALFCVVHVQNRSGYGIVWVGQLTDMVNQLLEKSNQCFRVQPRKVGSALTSLGFVSRERTNQGWQLWLDKSDKRKIHELAKTYGLDHLSDSFIEHVALEANGVPVKGCALCEEAKPSAARESQQEEAKPQRS